LIRTLSLAADALGESDTADVVLDIMRELAAAIEGESDTALITLITAGLGVILDPSSESLTTSRYMDGLTVKRYMESLTTQRTTSKA
jgi:hypothetical protein